MHVCSRTWDVALLVSALFFVWARAEAARPQLPNAFECHGVGEVMWEGDVFSGYGDRVLLPPERGEVTVADGQLSWQDDGR